MTASYRDTRFVARRFDTKDKGFAHSDKPTSRSTDLDKFKRGRARRTSDRVPP
ncbi:hypothetical protein GCM10010401_15520 [Rarobacter faecitabidus]